MNKVTLSRGADPPGSGYAGDVRGAKAALGAIGLMAACGGAEPSASSFAVNSSGVVSVSSSAAASTTTTTTTTSGAGSSSGAGPEASSTSSTGASETTDPLRDVGSVDFGETKPAGCKGKIDFLFMISRSGGMDVIQDQLVAAFPAFIETIEAKFPEFDYHIMVVDSDDHWGHLWCNDDCSPEGCPVDDYPCEMVDALSACDTTMGAGTVLPAGLYASNKLCPMVGGRRYFTREQPDPLETFTCAARVGASGYHRLGEAVTAAVSPALNGPGGCNEGFLRDDALLMVTFIQHSYDHWSAGKPKLWAEALLAAKHGDPESLVMFSICDTGCPPQDRICDLVKHYFPYWYISDSQAPDYAPAFEQATDLLIEACASFIPG